ncbi:hypothetical protein P7K49_001813 [Saguinus oedipus]|uniref:Uncharacterized protein n=1 Tax=Saguinus oedipus TaxID=9490 RepID=A0ABQ9WJG4_SAGOE|nr:hypothetical protein P7K49_001813 [Saguinus oedipus]
MGRAPVVAPPPARSQRPGARYRAKPRPAEAPPPTRSQPSGPRYRPGASYWPRPRPASPPPRAPALSPPGPRVGAGPPLPAGVGNSATLARRL